MNVLMSSARAYDRESFEAAQQARGGPSRHAITYVEQRLDRHSSAMAAGQGAVCCFVNDELDSATLGELHRLGVKAVCLRCTGTNNVDLRAAASLGLPVLRVPSYGPAAVAEFSVGLLLSLNRKIHRAYNRVRNNNFDLTGLVGFNLQGRTAGVIGTGRIGSHTARLLLAFGMTVLAHDPYCQPQSLRSLGVVYLPLAELLQRSDVVSLHCPLNAETHHLLDGEALAQLKPGALLVNTGRGGLIDTAAAIAALKRGQLAGLALDVYEQEQGLFFSNHSEELIDDDLFERLLTFPNVLVTGHQAFLSRDALATIAETSLDNFDALDQGRSSLNQVQLPPNMSS